MNLYKVKEIELYLSEVGDGDQSCNTHNKKSM
ncbi:MAG: hypothetical protein CM15mV11_3200 [Caudoviricetes sp.]|nr:MAG: hypothetical protein CM15mV11_3200 [Caudoviricetes sp.]